MPDTAAPTLIDRITARIFAELGCEGITEEDARCAARAVAEEVGRVGMEAADEIERLRGIISRLVDPQPPKVPREVLDRRIAEDRQRHLSLRQIARKHGVGVSVVRTSLARTAAPEPRP